MKYITICIFEQKFKFIRSSNLKRSLDWKHTLWLPEGFGPELDE